MTSDRPYRKAMDYSIARDRLLAGDGKPVRTHPVIAFLAVLAEASDDYRYAKGSGFGEIDTSEAFELVESSLVRADLGAA